MQIFDLFGQWMAGNEAWLWAALPLAAMAYLAPLLIAFERRHRYAWTIGAINVATGWTLVGWVAALLWALNRDVKEAMVAAPAGDSLQEPRWVDGAGATALPDDADFKKCPYCAEPIRAEAIVCRFCGRDLVLPGARHQAAPAADLDEQEKLRIRNLLAEGEDSRDGDPRLLDVFEYVRLLEDNAEAGNVIPMTPADAGGVVATPAPEHAETAPEVDWNYASSAAHNRR